MCEELIIIIVDLFVCGELLNCILIGKDCINGFKCDYNGCWIC